MLNQSLNPSCKRTKTNTASPSPPLSTWYYFPLLFLRLPDLHPGHIAEVVTTQLFPPFLNVSLPPARPHLLPTALVSPLIVTSRRGEEGREWWPWGRTAVQVFSGHFYIKHILY